MPAPLDKLLEQVLVVRVLAGDPDAFRELVERYDARLRYYLRRMLADDARADDALQEVWLAVHRKLPTLADPGAFGGWVYRIAHNAALADLRRRRMWTSLDDHEAAALADDHPTPNVADESTFSPADAARIHALLGELPAAQREVLVLRFLEGLPYEQIARIVGRPLGTVRSRIHYAKQTLRRRLRGES